MASSKEYIEEYVTINGIEQYFLHYPMESDFVVLFLHGGPGQTEAPFAYKTVLPDRLYSIVYYDQRGTGKTQLKNNSKPATITMEVLIEDLKETVRYIRKKYPNRKLILLGHSWGSILGVEFIKRYADSVDAYVGMGQVVNFLHGEKVGYEHCFHIAQEKDRKRLLAIGNYPDSVTVENAPKKCTAFRKIQGKYGLMGYRQGISQLIKIWIKSPIFSLGDVRSLSKGRKINARLMEYLVTYDTSEYTDAEIPVYFISGENDWQVPSVCVENYFKSLTAKDKELYWIKNAGHLTDLENPAEYNKTLCSICERLQRI